MKSIFPDICCDDLAKSKEFYMALFDFKEVVDIGWYVQLCSSTDENAQIAFVERKHHSVPTDHQVTPQGVVVTVEVNDVDKAYEIAKTRQLTIIKQLVNETWGQRHFMALDPNNLIVDIYSMLESDPEDFVQNPT